VIKRMLAERGITRFVLIASPLHMRRSMLTFEQQGMHPIASPAQLIPARSTPPNPLLPSELSLQIGDSVLYEWLARGYYWWRGWV